VFLADGPVLLAEAVEAGAEIDSVYAEPAGLDAPAVRAARDLGVPVHPVRDGTLARTLDLRNPQPVVAVVRHRPPTLSEVVAVGSEAAPLLVLVELQDPGNAGTLVRVAEAAGCRGVVFTSHSVDVTNPKTVRATAGSLFRVPVVTEVGVEEVLDACVAAGLATVATVRGDGDAYDRAELPLPLALLVGSEAHGLDPGVIGRCDHRITIPMAGQVESLNAAVAGAVVLFELARRRRSGSNWRGSPAGGPQ
jgi:TrmH family RNA methyltransferase